ncbi:MAG: thermonuclease family protein [Treponema sp.]|nr:thermonuclease family protein [Treponema sp.]
MAIVKLAFIPVFFFLASASPRVFAAGESLTVYVTNSGRRYHQEGCSSLKRSKIAVTLADAVRSGYRRCSICKPPALARPQEPAPAGALYRVNAADLTGTSRADWLKMVPAVVVGCVDGDTVRVRIPNPPGGLGAIETIRMLGVDTPETVHPSRPVERFGKEAGEFTKARLLGREVRICFDWDLRDRYGRLLAYIYTGPGECFNAAIIREGYAHAYVTYAFQFMDEFKALEAESRREKKGLWGD